MVRNALKAAIGCLFVVVLLAETAIAQSTLIEGVPPQAELSERLAVIESLETEPTADQQRDQAALTAALQAYERLQAIEERQQALEQRVSQAPEQLLRLERELNAAQEESLQLSVDNLSDMPLEALEAELADAVIELQQLQSQMAEVNSQLLAAQTLPERAQQAISEALQRAETLRREHDTRAALLADRQLSAREDAQLIQWRLERAVAEQEVTLNQRELSANSRLRELAQQRRDLIALQIDQQEQQLNLLQGVIDRQRRLQSEQAIADAAKNDPLIAEGTLSC
ncbi:hypothetical protein HAALTHF_46020n [Vreelandella aquamarina]|nr:hypothetical protein HAALTHF_46020n [Halomonas axialensis]